MRGRCELMLVLISIYVSSSECGTYSVPMWRKHSLKTNKLQPLQDAEFDWWMIKHVFQQHNENLAMSTLSIKFLLNMLYEGTKNQSLTQLELMGPLGRNQDVNEVPRCVDIMPILMENSDQLLISSRVFVDRYIPVAQKYASTLNEKYQVQIDSLDFEQPELAADTINSWVSNSTRGMIKKFIKSEDIEENDLLLMNSIYFKGLWHTEFNPRETMILPFKTALDTTVKVPFMVQTQDHHYAKSNEIQAELLRLPYAEGRFSMIIVLPYKSSNLNKLLNLLTPQLINEAITTMEETELVVMLPKFRISNEVPLKSDLQQMGIKRIFEDDAELDLMFAAGGPAKVTQIRQKTVLEVDEKGSTVSTSSFAGVGIRCGGCGPKEFEADRPFLFFIKEETTGTVVFAGKVENPAE